MRKYEKFFKALDLPKFHYFYIIVPYEKNISTKKFKET